MDMLFHSLTSENALTSTAAVECIQELAKFLGPSILRGRVELYNPRYYYMLVIMIVIISSKIVLKYIWACHFGGNVPINIPTSFV